MRQHKHATDVCHLNITCQKLSLLRTVFLWKGTEELQITNFIWWKSQTKQHWASFKTRINVSIYVSQAEHLQMTSLSASVCTDNVPRLSGRAHLENAIYREERNTTGIHLCVMATNHNLAKVDSFLDFPIAVISLYRSEKNLNLLGQNPRNQSNTFIF